MQFILLVSQWVTGLEVRSHPKEGRENMNNYMLKSVKEIIQYRQSDSTIVDTNPNLSQTNIIFSSNLDIAVFKKLEKIVYVCLCNRNLGNRH